MKPVIPVLLVAIMVLPILAMTVPARAASGYSPNFFLDANYSKGGLTQEVELEIRNNAVPTPTITMPNLGSFDEFEWWKGTSTSDKQVFWGPDCLIVGGLDVSGGPTPVGGGTLTFTQINDILVKVNGPLSGYFGPTRTLMTFIFSNLVVDNDAGHIFSGSLIIVSDGAVFGSTDALGSPDSGHWYIQGGGGWVVTFTSSTPVWSVDVNAYLS